MAIFPALHKLTHMETFLCRWNHLRLGQCLLRTKWKGKTSLHLRGHVIRGVGPTSWKRSMHPTPLQVLLWLIWRFHLWSPKGYQYQSPEIHLDINKTNSRQTTHPCHSSQHSSPPSPRHSDVHLSILQDSCSVMKEREELPPLKLLIDKGGVPIIKMEICFFPWRGRGGLEYHIPILKNDFFKNHLESFPDCENVFCT